MFWGCVLKKNQNYKVQHALQDGEFPVLHLSNAVLVSSKESSKKDSQATIVTISMKASGESQVEKEIKNLIIATLYP